MFFEENNGLDTSAIPMIFPSASGMLRPTELILGIFLNFFTSINKPLNSKKKIKDRRFCVLISESRCKHLKIRAIIGRFRNILNNLH